MIKKMIPACAGEKPVRASPCSCSKKRSMMATLEQANEQNGYFMTDSSTWVAAKKEMNNLKILFRGDPFLINTYHALCQPQGATDGQPYAAKFIDFVVSEEGQSLVRN